MTSIQKQKIESLRHAGRSYAAIAAEAGISENTIKSYCYRNNLGIAVKPQNVGEVCEQCRRALDKSSRQKRFCSYDCRMVWWRREYARRRRENAD